MRLTVLGCAGSFPGPDSPCSSYLVETDGFRLLVDLGSGALSALQRHIGLYDVDAVVLSHLHPDHWFDLCPYMVARQYGGGQPLPPLPVYSPPGLTERLTMAYDQPPDVYDIRPLTAGRLQIGPVAVHVQRVNHPVETYGLRIEHGGRVLTYSADTGPCDALVDLARDADVLLCEASFVSGPGNTRDLHLTGAQAGEHATRAGVGRLLLTHLVAWNDVEQVRAEAAATFTGDLALARPGGVYEI